MSGNSYVLSADVGGTNLRVAAVDRGGNILNQTTRLTPRTGDAEEIVDAIIAACESCLSELSPTETPLGFGLALAALVHPSEGRIYSSPNLPQLDGVPLAKLVAERLETQVVLENDATAAAIGEHWLGASRGIANSVSLTIGTGIGGGLILNNEPYRGVIGTAGELGHICVEADGHPCGCGSHGCLEQYASATAVVRIARDLAKAGVSTLDLRRDFTAKDVYQAAVAGDSVAIDAFRTMGRYLGIALADIINVLNPELVVLAGGGAGAWDFFIDTTSAEMKKRAFAQPADAVRIVRASLGGTAGLVGAARVAFSLSADPSDSRQSAE